MEDKKIEMFIEVIEQAKLKGFVCDITTKRIILHFKNEHQQVYLNEINELISKLKTLIDIDTDKIHFVKEFKYLELWIPLNKEIKEISIVETLKNSTK